MREGSLFPSVPCLNESPHPKVGKSGPLVSMFANELSLNESPHPKVGKYEGLGWWAWSSGGASMKVPTRRWGNPASKPPTPHTPARLNESPHPKVGKFPRRYFHRGKYHCASMKVPTRRWGNVHALSHGPGLRGASMKVPTRR